jgi:hypothetical protein
MFAMHKYLSMKLHIDINNIKNLSYNITTYLNFS